MLNLSFFQKVAGLLAAIFMALYFSPGGFSAQSRISDAGDGIPDVFVYSDAGGAGTHTLLIDKENQQLIVYENRSDGIFEKRRYRCSTGEVPGPKERSGDKKTPEGVYFIVNRFSAKDLTPVYGTRAFPLDYPNLLDNMAGRTGYSIWMHGRDKPLKDRNSNGCIVLENSSIEQVEQYVVLNRTPVIVVPHLSFQDRETFQKGKAKIFGFLTDWNRALETGSRLDFMRLYNPSALAGVSTWWHDWEKVNKVFSANLSPLSMTMKQIAVYRHRDGYVALFDQMLEAHGRQMSAGTRKLFFKSVGGRFQIVGDTYQTGGKRPAGDPVHPFIETCRKLAETLVPISDA
jgi:murein L,D-transpeptidase YafK